MDLGSPPHRATTPDRPKPSSAANCKVATVVDVGIPTYFSRSGCASSARARRFSAVAEVDFDSMVSNASQRPWFGRVLWCAVRPRSPADTGRPEVRRGGSSNIQPKRGHQQADSDEVGANTINFGRLRTQCAPSLDNFLTKQGLLRQNIWAEFHQVRPNSSRFRLTLARPRSTEVDQESARMARNRPKFGPMTDIERKWQEMARKPPALARDRPLSECNMVGRRPILVNCSASRGSMHGGQVSHRG